MHRRPNGWKEVSQEEITAWVERYRASSLGLRRFAEENGIPVQRMRLVQVAPVFQEIKLPASLAQQSWALEVSLPNGVAIRFENLPKPAWLGSLVKALRPPC
jgi:hypothetical protein